MHCQPSGVQLAAKWEDAVTSLAQEAADALAPSALAAFGVHDPRFYVKVITSLGGNCCATATLPQPGRNSDGMHGESLSPHDCMDLTQD